MAISANQANVSAFLKDFIFQEKRDLFSLGTWAPRTRTEFVQVAGSEVPRYINEFWTSKQRQASSIHEIAYRACFKPQLPRFFIELLTRLGDTVYDPFSGRGTTVIEAALLGRSVVGNDVNPLSKILTLPRLRVPEIEALEQRLKEIPIEKSASADLDLSMFYHRQTLREIVSLKNYLAMRPAQTDQDDLDSWIRMVATNRLTGHSPGFFSVYTMPPNQAVSAESQKRINQKRSQEPEYRDTKAIILKKSKQLLNNLSPSQRNNLSRAADRARFLIEDARHTSTIPSSSAQLTVTSPPFLDVVQYAQDNWLRCWFNGIDADQVAKRITISKTLEAWSQVMQDVFLELYRITSSGGWVAFEVGEVRSGQLKLDEYVVPLGLRAGFICEGILVNQQEFTKTANIWGITNNIKGTNTNRVVIFYKQ